MSSHSAKTVHPGDASLQEYEQDGHDMISAHTMPPGMGR